MQQHDLDLTPQDLHALTSADAVAELFSRMGYQPQRQRFTPLSLGIENQDLLNHIMQTGPGYDIEEVASIENLRVFLFHMRTLRAVDREALARVFRNRAGLHLLVLADRDFDHLDFVLLDDLALEGKAAGLRPRLIRVDRQNPDPLALRALKRFTYTEADPDFQFDKLRAAYTVAEWAEPFFNNRALFSDHYLNTRLRAEPEWQEPQRDAYHALAGLMQNARERLAGLNTEDFGNAFLVGALDALDWDYESADAQAEGPQPDLYLYAPENDQRLALCLAYPWNRLLDGRDDKDKDRPDHNPGAQVVSILERGEAPFAILTNGKVWRLYARDARSRATNYYEIDLEEALASRDREEAFRYFWLFFRRAAFESAPDARHPAEPPRSFIERVMAGSELYAKELGDRLKDRIFSAIFPHFARGFIAGIRAAEGPDALIDEARLDLIYKATLTFLYRLMFLLYAEARELLPARDPGGYGPLSLGARVAEIAARAGEIEDGREGNLKRAWRGGGADLYAQLTQLFRAIDQGDPALNLPRYNGGLFSPETPEGRFLSATPMPDLDLALGLDLLARDVDTKQGTLARIDYKSLGVRQLGSIYEGLLEFKLRRAVEPLAVIKEKGKESYKPLAEIGKERVIAQVAAGEPYIENNKRERKATGSYYTPDYIVEYIVKHTVGPVMDEKLKNLVASLRRAEEGYELYKRNAKARESATGVKEHTETYWNSEAMLKLAADLLDLKVLDPAMGSGHFLVQAVDFITDRLIDFLNGYPHNPLKASLRRTRESILQAMEAQGVSIDATRLTDVNLLKRAVLKRCIYGVDLNPMAVELAKVSLWLDAFTLGAPLSFLDHHLRCGNSLIGATAREADAELSQMGKAPGQMTFMTGPFKGLLRAAEVMRGVSMLADATIEQAEQSANLFAEFERAARPYKQLLDIYVMRAFGVKRADEFLRLHGAEALSLPAEKIGKPYDEVLREREKMYGQYRFFHWDLEFPEVFIDLDKADWREDAGFDAIIGNPPYDELSEDALGREVVERVYLTGAEVYRPTQDSSGRLNWYHYFMVIGVVYLRFGGQTGLIVPMSWMGDSFTLGVRQWLLNEHQPALVEAFPQKDDPNRRVFFDAKLPTSIVVYQKGRRNSQFAVRKHPGKDIENSLPYQAELDTIASLTPDTLLIPIVTPYGWDILRKVSHNPHLGKLAEVAAEPTSGEIIFNAATRPYFTTDSSYELVLRGSHVQRYELADSAKQGDPVYLLKDEYLKVASADSKAWAHLHPRIVYQEASALDAWRRVVATYLPENHICGHKICYFVNYKIDMYALLAVFSSSLINWLVESLSVTNALSAYLVGNLWFPVFENTAGDQSNEQAIELTLEQFSTGSIGVVHFVENSSSKTIHDLLAYLAQQMIDLNQQKQAETRRFLGWLETALGAQVESFTGKTILQGYLGDYQKHEPELPWADFEFRLRQNRRKIRADLDAVLGEIRAQYLASLEHLRPIKARLAATDRLIDQIVYQLYGLTEEEIRLIEGPAYEEALRSGKQAALSDEKLKDDPQAAFDYLSERLAPAAERLAALAPSAQAAASLDADLPGWRNLPPRAMLLLQQAEADTLDEHRIDYSGAAINYAKAVEITIRAWLFEPFRAAGYTDRDVVNDKAFKPYMRGERELTLGNYPFLFSSREAAFRQYAVTIYPDADRRLFDGGAGVLAYLGPDEIARRNGAAHEQMFSREEALAARQWSLAILGLMLG